MGCAREKESETEIMKIAERSTNRETLLRGKFSIKGEGKNVNFYNNKISEGDTESE